MGEWNLDASDDMRWIGTRRMNMPELKGLRRIAMMTMITAMGVFADELPADKQAKLDAKVGALASWSTATEIVQAVKAHNAKPEHPDYTNDTWKTLTVIDPKVRSFSQGPVAVWIKAHKDPAMSEVFVSGADGAKVAFLTKTTSWTHKGKAKHENPMAGKPWQGEVEVDAPTGARQVQVSIPVLDEGKPIGSIVVGYSISKL